MLKHDFSYVLVKCKLQGEINLYYNICWLEKDKWEKSSSKRKLWYRRKTAQVLVIQNINIYIYIIWNMSILLYNVFSVFSWLLYKICEY